MFAEAIDWVRDSLAMRWINRAIEDPNIKMAEEEYEEMVDLNIDKVNAIAKVLQVEPSTLVAFVVDYLYDKDETTYVVEFNDGRSYSDLANLFYGYIKANKLHYRLQATDEVNAYIDAYAREIFKSIGVNTFGYYKSFDGPAKLRMAEFKYIVDIDVKLMFLLGFKTPYLDSIIERYRVTYIK